MNKKEKIRTLPITSREALDAAVAGVATLKIEYAADKAAMELEIARVQERHQGEMLASGKQQTDRNTRGCQGTRSASRASPIDFSAWRKRKIIRWQVT